MTFLYEPAVHVVAVLVFRTLQPLAPAVWQDMHTVLLESGREVVNAR